jgi:hypothetical protein
MQITVIMAILGWDIMMMVTCWKKKNPQVELYAVPYVLPPPRWMFLRCALQQLCKSQEELDKGIRILSDLLHDLQAQSSFPAHHINWPATFGPKKRPKISHICIRLFWRKNYQLPEKPNTFTSRLVKN